MNNDVTKRKQKKTLKLRAISMFITLHKKVIYPKNPN